MANFKRQDGLGATGVLCIPQATKQGYIEVEQGGVFDAAYPESTTRRGRVQEGGKVTPTICTSNELCVYEGVEFKGRKCKDGAGVYLNDSDRFFRGGLKDMSRTLKGGEDAGVVQNYRIRKLTPRECFRLMGVTEENIDKIQAAGISNAQQYKMAGNSIVVDVLYHIFRKMFVDKESDNAELTLF
ncbi:MAG: DNA cytosine methyltransferase [Bacteroidales bacterium]|nr:DNA cytosine methyltransferase [Bacteroidales bacterium]